MEKGDERGSQYRDLNKQDVNSNRKGKSRAALSIQKYGSKNCQQVFSAHATFKCSPATLKKQKQVKLILLIYNI